MTTTMSSLNPKAAEFIPNTNQSPQSTDIPCELQINGISTFTQKARQQALASMPIVSYQHEYKRHIREKPYKCSFNGCKKAFTQSSNCKAHQRIHIGKKARYNQLCRWTELNGLSLDITSGYHHPCEPEESVHHELIVNKLLFDDINNILYILCVGFLYKYSVYNGDLSSIKCAQPLFSNSTCSFLPGSDNKKLIVLDSNSFVHDYIYIYNIGKNQIEFRNVIQLPMGLRNGHYQMCIASIAQKHKTLSQLQFVYVINYLYGALPMDVLQIVASFYFNAVCHIVDSTCYCTLEISSIYNCMGNIHDEIQCSKYRDRLRKECCSIKHRFNIRENHRIFVVQNQLFVFAVDGQIEDELLVFGVDGQILGSGGDASFCLNIDDLTETCIVLPIGFTHFECINVNNEYFIIFDRNKSGLIYFCRVNEVSFWKRSQITLPKHDGTFEVCLVNDDVHILCGDSLKHYRMPLASILIQQIVNIHK